MGASFNELFGLGVHPEDATLEGWWPLQDDVASTVVDDQSINANDGALVGGDNTADVSTTGPNSWLTKALAFDGSADYVDCGDVARIGTGDVSILCRINTIDTGTFDGIVVKDATGFNGGLTKGYALGNGGLSAGSVIASVDDGTAEIQSRASTASGSIAINDGSWHSLAGVIDRDDNATSMIYIDGSDNTTSTNGTTATGDSDTTQTLKFMTRTAGAGRKSGSLCDVSIFSRILTAAELVQWNVGPELNYSSGVSFGDDGAYDVGTWSLPSPFASGSNGTPTYEVVAVNAAGSVLDSATTATGTLDISSEAGSTCYLLVRASNAGGYDIGDQATRTSGYGFSGDGYYEIASVVAAGGGGGVSVTMDAGAGSGIGHAPSLTIGVQVNVAIGAGIGSGSGNDLAESIGKVTSLGAGLGSGSGNAPTVTVGGAVNVQVGVGAGSGVGLPMSPATGLSVDLSAGAGSGTGNAMTVSVGAQVSVAMGAGAGSGVGPNASEQIGFVIPLSAGIGSGEGYQPTVVVGGTVSVTLGPGSGTGAGYEMTATTGVPSDIDLSLRPEELRIDELHELSLT